MVDYNLQRIVVLVIDDYPPMRRLMFQILRSLGVRKILEAESGADGVACASEHNPDVIFTDMEMSPVNGAQFTRMIRAGGDGIDPYTPIIVCSGLTRVRHVVEAREAGVHGFLVKPVSPRSVYGRLTRVIDNPPMFVRCAGYFGPERRGELRPFAGDDRRRV